MNINSYNIFDEIKKIDTLVQNKMDKANELFFEAECLRTAIVQNMKSMYEFFSFDSLRKVWMAYDNKTHKFNKNAVNYEACKAYEKSIRNALFFNHVTTKPKLKEIILIGIEDTGMQFDYECTDIVGHKKIISVELPNFSATNVSNYRTIKYRASIKTNIDGILHHDTFVETLDFSELVNAINKVVL